MPPETYLLRQMINAEVEGSLAGFLLVLGAGEGEGEGGLDGEVVVAKTSLSPDCDAVVVVFFFRAMAEVAMRLWLTGEFNNCLLRLQVSPLRIATVACAERSS